MPKQAAELVDALLKRSRRKEQAERKKMNAVYYNTLTVKSGTSATTTKEDGLPELCTSCGSIVHSNQARFCWYCGCELEADSE